MIGTYLIGIGGIVGLMVLWIVVQSLWRRIFADHITDEDVLAERRSCANCGCTTVCINKLEEHLPRSLRSRPLFEEGAAIRNSIEDGGGDVNALNKLSTE